MSATIVIGSSIKTIVDGLETKGIVFRIEGDRICFYSSNFRGDNWSCTRDEATLIDDSAQSIADTFGLYFWNYPKIYEPLGLVPPSPHIIVGSSIKTVVRGQEVNGLVHYINDDMVHFYCAEFGGDIWSCDKSEIELTDVPKMDLVNQFKSWFWDSPDQYGCIGLTLDDRVTFN